MLPRQLHSSSLFESFYFRPALPCISKTRAELSRSMYSVVMDVRPGAHTMSAGRKKSPCPRLRVRRCCALRRVPAGTPTGPSSAPPIPKPSAAAVSSTAAPRARGLPTSAAASAPAAG